MKQEIAEQWVTALQSGDYLQGPNQLRKGNAFCCLGVLCDLHMRAHSDDYNTRWEIGSSRYSYLGSQHYVPVVVQEWSGLRSKDGTIDHQYINLLELNDSGVPFTEIARIIEEDWAQL